MAKTSAREAAGLYATGDTNLFRQLQQSLSEWFKGVPYDRYEVEREMPNAQKVLFHWYIQGDLTRLLIALGVDRRDGLAALLASRVEKVRQAAEDYRVEAMSTNPDGDYEFWEDDPERFADVIGYSHLNKLNPDRLRLSICERDLWHAFVQCVPAIRNIEDAVLNYGKSTSIPPIKRPPKPGSKTDYIYKAAKRGDRIEAIAAATNSKPKDVRTIIKRYATLIGDSSKLSPCVAEAVRLAGQQNVSEDSTHLDDFGRQD